MNQSRHLFFIFTILLLLFIIPSYLFTENETDEDIAYRDYLISILMTIPDRNTGLGDPEFTPQFTDEEIRSQVLRYLRDTFKQDFDTTDNRKRTIPEIATTIVKRILREDLNVPLSGIPERGSYSSYEYLNILIELTGKSRWYLSTRYFFNFNRSGLDISTSIKETISTLQQFMRDGKFGKEAPSDSLFKLTHYNPFFFYQDEWGAQEETVYYPENHYSFKKGVFRTEPDRERAENLIEDYGGTIIKDKKKSLIEEFLLLDDNLKTAHHYYAREEYPLAEEYYKKSWNNIDAIATIMSRMTNYMDGNVTKGLLWRPNLDSPEEFRASLDVVEYLNINEHLVDGFGLTIDIPAGIIPPAWSFGNDLLTNLEYRYDNRKEYNVKNASQLISFEYLNTVTCTSEYDIMELTDALISLIPHIRFLLLPVCLGDLYTAMGDFTAGASFYAQCSREHLLRGSLSTKSPPSVGESILSESNGDLPWNSVFNNTESYLNGADYPYLNTDCESLYIKIHVADLYLQWADYLYKNNIKTETARARELYKAVMKINNRIPVYYQNLQPVIIEDDEEENDTSYVGSYATDDPVIGMESIPDILFEDISNDSVYWMEERESAVTDEIPTATLSDPAHNPVKIAPIIIDLLPVINIINNPIIKAQLGKAQMGISQIDAGLNFYGFSPEVFSLLRYEVLIQSAKSFANLAKQAQDDYLSYLEKAEQADMNVIETEYAVKKAGKRVEMEQLRIKQQTLEVQIAGIQVKQVKDAIEAKQAEMDKAGSFGGQIKSLFKGIAGFFKGVPSSATKAIGSDFSAAWSGSGFIGGAAGAGGIALFGIASYFTIDGMVSERNALRNQLKTLKTRQLPLAETALRAKEHELAITQIQSVIAALEEEFTRELYTYQTMRVLNADTLRWMAQAVKGVMKRYIDLSSMTGWLAQKALNYEQNRSVDIIRFNYYTPSRQGILAAENLQADLALLEKEYLYGYQVREPIKWNISLARDFPFSFGQLINTGTCDFMTETDPFTTAFPGSHSHRLRTVGVTVIAPSSEATFHGVLSNDGISYILNPNQQEKQVSIRPPDAFPVSAFRWEKDMTLYGLPEKVLLPFEGSGVETYWNLTFPPEANPGMLTMIADVVITFETYTQFSPGVFQLIPETEHGEESHLNLFSIRQLNQESFNDFITYGDNTIRFDITDAHFPPTETGYEMENVYILFAGDFPEEMSGTLWNPGLSAAVPFTTLDGLAFTNTIDEVDPTDPGHIPYPFETITNNEPRTRWAVTIEPGQNPDLERELIKEIIFGIEYTHKPTGH